VIRAQGVGSAGLLTTLMARGWGLSEHDAERIIMLKLGMGWSNKEVQRAIGHHLSRFKIRRVIRHFARTGEAPYSGFTGRRAGLSSEEKNTLRDLLELDPTTSLPSKCVKERACTGVHRRSAWPCRRWA
jgi:transposase